MRKMMNRNLGTSLVSACTFASVLFFAACSSSDDKDVSGGASGDAGIVAITDKEVAGVSQKGPFLVGSSVTLQELDGHTFAQTGRSFKASIKSDQGDFSIKGVNLISQYALLEVNGYYYNEVSGKKSDGMIILNALTDLESRNQVNVNLLTHLETDRVLRLVQKQGLSFADAKKQAEREILSSLGFTGLEASPEDLDLFVKDEGGEALLALGVLMLGKGSSADLSERLARASFAFADSGSWVGKSKTELADWALEKDLERLKYGSGWSVWDSVMLNIESLTGEFSESSFVKYIRKFWAHDYGLGECGENNLNAVQSNVNPLSGFYGADFVCVSEYDDEFYWELVGRHEPSGDLSYVIVNDFRDGERYVEMDFGGITWMTENLRYDAHGADACYGNESVKCATYGRLYGDGVDCPREHHMPTRAEVEKLLEFFGGSGKEAAQKMRSVDGFNALYGGYGMGTAYEGINETAVFWTASRGYESGYIYILKIDSAGARLDSTNIPLKASVRCVADYEIPPEKSKFETFVDERDGYAYGMNAIGELNWMLENLRYNKFVELEEGQDKVSPCKLVNGECFYTWENAVGDSTGGVCPEGWRLPSADEWYTMLEFVADSVKELETNGKIYYTNNQLRNPYYWWDWLEGDYYFAKPYDPYGFNILPVGRFEDDYYFGLDETEFWTSSEDSDSTAIAIYVENFIAIYSGNPKNKQSRASIRCVQPKEK